MSAVFRNIDPPHPLTARRVCTLPLVRGEDTIAGWRGGWGVNSEEDARHCFVLYICKYFVFKGLDFISRGKKSTSTYIMIFALLLLASWQRGERNVRWFLPFNPSQDDEVLFQDILSLNLIDETGRSSFIDLLQMTHRLHFFQSIIKVIVFYCCMS